MKGLKIITSNDERIDRVGGILDGLTQSATNAVIFRDSPEVWFQFFLGLYLDKPTFVLIEKKDLGSATAWMLNRPNVYIVDVEKMDDDDELRRFAETIETWVKKEVK
jgi:hypothetical protein